MLNEIFIPHKLKTVGTSITNFSKPLVIVPEEHNIALKFEDEALYNDHSALSKQYKANLSLPSSPLLLENHCSKKLHQIMTKDDKILWDLITALKNGRPVRIPGSYMENYEKDLHTRDELLFLDHKLLVPAAIRGAFSSMLHESHPGQFGMKFLVAYIFGGRISTRSTTRQVLLGSQHSSKFPDF